MSKRDDLWQLTRNPAAPLLIFRDAIDSGESERVTLVKSNFWRRFPFRNEIPVGRSLVQGADRWDRLRAHLTFYGPLCGAHVRWALVPQGATSAEPDERTIHLSNLSTNCTHNPVFERFLFTWEKWGKFFTITLTQIFWTSLFENKLNSSLIHVGTFVLP